MSRPVTERSADAGRASTIAQEVARLARQILGPEVEVIWFGSWPRKRALPHSDIDIAVSADKPIPVSQMALLREAVDGLSTLYTVDILDLTEASPSLRQEILKHGVRL